MWDIATARVKTGLTAVDTTNDVALQVSMDSALALIEKYCDRHFLYQEQTDSFIRPTYRASLSRYPIESIKNVIGNAYKEVNKLSGVIELHSTEKAHVTYNGGYKTLPADLELAFWAVFASVNDALSSTGATLSGGLKKLQITGVGSIDYDTSSGGATSGGGAFGGMIPEVAMSILDLYVRESA